MATTGAKFGDDDRVDRPQEVGIASMGRLFCWLGIAVGASVTAVDFYTSVLGLRQILGTPPGQEYNLIVMAMPIIGASFVLTFNGLSGYLYRMYARAGNHTFSMSIMLILWVLALAFDFITSVTGLLKIYSSVHVDSWESAMQAMDRLGPAPSCFVIAIAILLGFGPFLATLFMQLLASSKK